MVTITTRDFGEMEFDEKHIINFPDGILAFEEYKKYVLIDTMCEENCPLWLQSVDSQLPCFIVFKLDTLIPNYEPKPLQEDLAKLNIEEDDDVQYFAIAVIAKDVSKSTLNLKSPVIINLTKGIAVQTVLLQDYDLKFPLFQKIKED